MLGFCSREVDFGNLVNKNACICAREVGFGNLVNKNARFLFTRCARRRRGPVAEGGGHALMRAFAAGEEALGQFHGQDDAQHNGDGHFHGHESVLEGQGELVAR